MCVFLNGVTHNPVFIIVFGESCVLEFKFPGPMQRSCLTLAFNVC